MKITIERHRWKRGQKLPFGIIDESGHGMPSEDPRAIIPNPNYKCCVFGFAINSGQYKSYRDFSLLNHGLVVKSKAIKINDDPTISDKQREKLLTKELEKFGCKVKFVD